MSVSRCSSSRSGLGSCLVKALLLALWNDVYSSTPASATNNYVGSNPAAVRPRLSLLKRTVDASSSNQGEILGVPYLSSAALSFPAGYELLLTAFSREDDDDLNTGLRALSGENKDVKDDVADIEQRVKQLTVAPEPDKEFNGHDDIMEIQETVTNLTGKNASDDNDAAAGPSTGFLDLPYEIRKKIVYDYRRWPTTKFLLETMVSRPMEETCELDTGADGEPNVDGTNDSKDDHLKLNPSELGPQPKAKSESTNAAATNARRWLCLASAAVSNGETCPCGKSFGKFTPLSIETFLNDFDTAISLHPTEMVRSVYNGTEFSVTKSLLFVLVHLAQRADYNPSQQGKRLRQVAKRFIRVVNEDFAKLVVGLRRSINETVLRKSKEHSLFTGVSPMTYKRHPGPFLGLFPASSNENQVLVEIIRERVNALVSAISYCIVGAVHAESSETESEPGNPRQREMVSLFEFLLSELLHGLPAGMREADDSSEGYPREMSIAQQFVISNIDPAYKRRLKRAWQARKMVREMDQLRGVYPELLRQELESLTPRSRKQVETMRESLKRYQALTGNGSSSSVVNGNASSYQPQRAPIPSIPVESDDDSPCNSTDGEYGREITAGGTMTYGNFTRAHDYSEYYESCDHYHNPGSYGVCEFPHTAGCKSLSSPQAHRRHRDRRRARHDRAWSASDSGDSESGMVDMWDGDRGDWLSTSFTEEMLSKETFDEAFELYQQLGQDPMLNNFSSDRYVLERYIPGAETGVCDEIPEILGINSESHCQENQKLKALLDSGRIFYRRYRLPNMSTGASNVPPTDRADHVIPNIVDTLEQVVFNQVYLGRRPVSPDSESSESSEAHNINRFKSLKSLAVELSAILISLGGHGGVQPNYPPYPVGTSPGAVTARKLELRQGGRWCGCARIEITDT